jgi:hypothetical protein
MARGGSDDDAVVARGLEELAEGMPHSPARPDASVDGDAGGRRAVLDLLVQLECTRARARHRRLERQRHRHGRQVVRDEGGLLDVGDPQRSVVNVSAPAGRRYRERNGGPPRHEVHGLGDIVMVDAVKEARARGVLTPQAMPDRLVPDGAVWPERRFRRLDAVIWCTGFAAALDHLAPLGILEPDERVLVDGTRAQREPRLWLVGYRGWTGFASATLIGVGRTARQTVEQIDSELADSGSAVPYARSA